LLIRVNQTPGFFLSIRFKAPRRDAIWGRLTGLESAHHSYEETRNCAALSAPPVAEKQQEIARLEVKLGIVLCCSVRLTQIARGIASTNVKRVDSG
jgi:hypothetical protein